MRALQPEAFQRLPQCWAPTRLGSSRKISLVYLSFHPKPLNKKPLNTQDAEASTPELTLNPNFFEGGAPILQTVQSLITSFVRPEPEILYDSEEA